MTYDDDELAEGNWEFYDSWAAFPHNRAMGSDDRIKGETMVSLASPGGGTLGEFAIRYYEFGDRWTSGPRIAARLEAFGDSWQALGYSGVVEALVALNGEVQDQDAVHAVLRSLGFEDVTAKLRGDSPAYCPACHGKGVLDEVAPSDRPTPNP